MKRILLIFLSVCTVINSFAQDRIHKPFKLDLAIGLLFPTGNTFLDGRLSFSVEPKYNISDQIWLGLRVEVDPNSNFGGTAEPFMINSVSSYLLTADYFFNKAKRIRPFFGVGAGIFKQTISNVDFPVIKTKSARPGAETRFGLERRHFRFAVEYNATFFKDEKKMNYVCLKFGAFLWGGRKNK